MTSLDPLSSFRLDGKVAVVTGASSGIGERFARVLDALGATVVVSARRTDRIDVVAANAGITEVTPATRESPARFAEVVTVDLVAPFELAQAAVPHLRAV